MALITFFEKIEKERVTVHEPVECGYFIFRSMDGHVFLQLETYGSKERKLQNKVSQSIQLDEASARKLRDIINSML